MTIEDIGNSGCKFVISFHGVNLLKLNFDTI